MLAGALQEPVDGALFVFKGASIEEIEGFVAAVRSLLFPTCMFSVYMTT